MDNTPFAGLERLDIGDPIGPGFLYRNPTIIDMLLRLGAVSHRHDAHASVTDPTGAPTVTPANLGGAIPSDTPVYVGWTWVDADGGETLLSDPTQVTTDPGLPDPTTAPDAAVDNTAGTLLAGTYYYAVTVTDGVGGESLIGPSTEVVVDPGFANSRDHDLGPGRHHGRDRRHRLAPVARCGRRGVAHDVAGRHRQRDR
jgi:hypothetical protein